MELVFLLLQFESSKTFLQIVCSVLLGGLVLALPFVWLSEKGVHPLRAFARVLGSRGPVGGCVLAVLFVAGTIFGGYKARGPAAAADAVSGTRPTRRPCA